MTDHETAHDPATDSDSAADDADDANDILTDPANLFGPFDTFGLSDMLTPFDSLAPWMEQIADFRNGLLMAAHALTQTARALTKILAGLKALDELGVRSLIREINRDGALTDEISRDRLMGREGTTRGP